MLSDKVKFHFSKINMLLMIFFSSINQNIFADDLFTSELVRAKNQVINWFQVLGSALFIINLLLLVMCYVSPFEALHNMKSKVTKAFVVTLVIYALSSIFSGTVGNMINSGTSCPLMLIGGTCQ
jgi:Ca2+/Na+ antiporter